MKHTHYRFICHAAALILSVCAMGVIAVDYRRFCCPISNGSVLVIIMIGAAVYWIVFALLSGDFKGL